MKDCQKIHPLLPLYRENRLSAREKATVEKHIKACPAAREEIKQWERLGKALKDMPEPPMSNGLHDQIMARLHHKSVPQPNPFWPRASWGLAAAASLGFLFFVQNSDWVGNKNSEIVVVPSISSSVPALRSAAKGHVETNITLKPQQNRSSDQPVTQMGLDKNLSTDINILKEMPSQPVAQAQLSIVTPSTDLALAPQERSKKMKMDMAENRAFQAMTDNSTSAAAAPQAASVPGVNDNGQSETKLALNYRAISPDLLDMESAQPGYKQTPKFLRFEITGINSGQYQVNWQTNLATKGQLYILDSTGNTLQAAAETTPFSYDHQMTVDASTINTGFFIKILATYLDGSQAVTVSNVLKPQ